jgi:hypothetical protein
VGFRVCVGTGKKPQQVPPLRYATVGMTILFGYQHPNLKQLFRYRHPNPKQKCHPDRSVPRGSVVEGPAVSLSVLTQSL